MKTPIFDEITKHKDHLSFHTPAHSGVIAFIGDTAKLDVTELTFSDNLLSPSGVIEESEREVSALYGVEKTTYVTSGATAAVFVALGALRGKTFLIAGAAHKSVFNATGVFAARAYYTRDTGNIDSALTLTKADAVIVTSPDYFGNALNLAEIKAAARAKGALLIVDAAHGSHFIFSDKLPVSATEYGDLVINSCHKTLPVLTGGAMLHYPEGLDLQVKSALNLTHSTSPSYLIMVSTEKALADYAANGKEYYEGIISAINAFTAKVKPPFYVKKTADPTRLVITSVYDGSAVSDELEKRGIYAECSDGNAVVFIVNRINASRLAELQSALEDIDVTCLPLSKVLPLPEKEGVTELIFSKENEFVTLDNSVGRVSAACFGKYPPGVPTVLCGEVISAEAVAFIKKCGNNCFGLVNGLVSVVK